MHLKHHFSEREHGHHQNPCWAFVIELYYWTSDASVTTGAISLKGCFVIYGKGTQCVFTCVSISVFERVSCKIWTPGSLRTERDPWKHICACMCECVCKDQVKVAPASSFVAGRIDHLIQIKDSPSTRGRDERVTQCKIELYGHCRALASGQELLCLFFSTNGDRLIVLLFVLLHPDTHHLLCSANVYHEQKC